MCPSKKETEIRNKVAQSLAYIDKEYSFIFNGMKLVEFTDMLRCFEWLLNKKEKPNGKEAS